MISNYKHHLHPRQSAFVKYRGNTGQIDIKDTIVTILSKKPGLNAIDIANLIFHEDLKKSIYQSVPRALDKLEEDDVLIKEEADGLYYLMSDAMSHDIGKTKTMMDALATKGITPEMVAFLSSGIVLAGEEAKLKSEGVKFNRDETFASAAVDTNDEPIKITKIEASSTYGTFKDEKFSYQNEGVEVFVENPFPLSDKDDVSIKLQVASDFIKEEQEKQLAIEKAKEIELAKKVAEFKEEVKFNSETGEIHIDGNKQIPYTKEIHFPSPLNDDRKPDIEIIKENETSHVEPKKTFFGWLKAFIGKS